MNQDMKLEDLTNIYNAHLQQWGPQIRDFLKTLSELDKFNVGLFGINPDESQLTSVVDYLLSSLAHVQTLDKIVENDFRIEGVLLPKDPELQDEMRKDYYTKMASMVKVLEFEPLGKAMGFSRRVHDKASQESKDNQHIL